MRRGFTLLEVMAVVAVIGVLSAIAVVSSASIRDDIQDRAAETAVERVVSAQRAHAAAEGVWAESSELGGATGLTVTGEVSSGPGTVSVTVGPDMTVGIASLSESGTCWAVVLTDPLQDARAIDVQVGARSPCSGGGALASLP